MKRFGKYLALGLVTVNAVLLLTAFNLLRVDYSRNYIENGSFEAGYYQHQGISEVTVPNEWKIWYAEESTPKTPSQDDPFRQPETVVWNGTHHPEPERSLFWQQGTYTFKAFGAWKPIWVKLWQDNSNVVAGQRYRFTVPIYPDLIESYQWDGRKIVASDPTSGQHRLVVTENGRIIADTGYLDGDDIPFLEWTDLELEFVPQTSNVRLMVEFRGKWGLINNGWFIDDISLHAVAGVATPTKRATSTPRVIVTPTVPPSENGTAKSIEGSHETFFPIVKTYSRRN